MSEPEHRILLELTRAIASHHSLADLADELAHRLNPLVAAEYVLLTLHDDEADVMRLRILGGPEAVRFRWPKERPTNRSPGGHVWTTQSPLLLSTAVGDPRFAETIEIMRADGIRWIWYLPLTSSRRRLGAIGFASTSGEGPNAIEGEFLDMLTRQVAVAVENAINFESAERLSRDLQQERDRLRILLDVNKRIAAELDLSRLINSIADFVRSDLGHPWTALAIHDVSRNELKMHTLDFPEGKGVIREGLSYALDAAPSGRAFTTMQTVISNAKDIEAYHTDVTRALLAEGIRSSCCVPLISRGRAIGTLNIGSTKEDTFDEDAISLLVQVAAQIAPAVDNAIAYRELDELRGKLAEEKTYLEEEIGAQFQEIVGDSEALGRVLADVETVARTDSTVLITGETGTGKELIARAIHRLSQRGERTFVKINCAAIPTGLLESELFGHEKGAFTGALAEKVGRFELATGGTLFLDEVGEIAPELQPKLLRVLQEQEFERLGGTRTIKVDVRLVAATNQDLAEMMAARRFRSDLYYRLNVFPVALPPLRERREDIPLLVQHFVEAAAKRMKKRIDTVPDEVLEAFSRYRWPGNVRELENVVERSVILSKGTVLDVPITELAREATVPFDDEAKPPERQTLAGAERRFILAALEESKWVVGGASGAAVRLGLSRTTLQARMRKLGIERPKSK
jgi:formate hydrogenlyase transcriptional activator